MISKNKKGKTLSCKECSEKVIVDNDVVAVTCWRCVLTQMGGHSMEDQLHDCSTPFVDSKKMSPDCQD